MGIIVQVDVKTAAKLLNVSEKSIYRWISQGKIPVYKVGEQYRFNRAELLEWAARERVSVSSALLCDTDTGDVPSLEQALRAGGVHYQVEGGDKPAVLRSVVELLPLPAEVDRGFLFEVLLARESLGSTGIGNGVAIPHVRNPIVLHIPRPIVALTFLDSPIDFQAIDHKPVRILFTIVSPSTKAHLSLLSRLMFCLSNMEFRGLLDRSGKREEIFDAVRSLENALPGSAAAGNK